MELSALATLAHAVTPLLPFVAPLLALVAVATCPMPGRGPVSRKRHEWRTFKYDNRRAVMTRASGRCEAPRFIVWGRCPEAATDADHIYPWSKGGPTTPSNGQALCREHNRSKSNVTPPWWYVAGLERRRRTYCSDAFAARVTAREGGAAAPVTGDTPGIDRLRQK